MKNIVAGTGNARSHLTLAIGLLFAVVFCGFAASARFRVLYKDDWDWVAPLFFHARFRDYVLLGGNEHIIVVPRALMWLDYRLNGLPGPLMWVVGLGSYLFTAATFVDHVWRRAELPPVLTRALAGATLSLIFFTYQLQVFLSPAGITIPLATAFGVGAMLALIRVGRGLERRHQVAWGLLSAVLAVAAILTSGQGLAVPFALLAIVLATRRPRVITGLAGVFVCFLVAWLYTRTTGVHGPSPNAQAMALTTLFGLAFFAGPVSFVSLAGGVLVGAMALAWGLYEGQVVVKTGRTSSDCQLLCLGTIVFVLITGAMTAIARANFGIAQASQSRYAFFAMLFLSVTLALWTIRTSQSKSGGRRLRLAYGVVLALMIAALPINVFVGAVWWAKAENARSATLALDVGVPDLEWIRTLHPDPMRPYEWRRARPASGTMGSSLIAPGDRSEDPRRASPAPQCDGNLLLQHMEAGRFFRVSGRVAAPVRATILLEDSAGTVQGRAEPAPIVGVPDPSYGQVIAAVGRAIRGGRLHEPEWFGFAQEGAGPPYRAFMVGQGNTTICTVSVSNAG